MNSSRRTIRNRTKSPLHSTTSWFPTLTSSLLASLSQRRKPNRRGALWSVKASMRESERHWKSSDYASRRWKPKWRSCNRSSKTKSSSWWRQAKVSGRRGSETSLLDLDLTSLETSTRSKSPKKKNTSVGGLHVFRSLLPKAKVICSCGEVRRTTLRLQGLQR